ncbi:GNAT family N-acetyltransferase [Erwinia sp.]|uniref:GNAT family N-acetyltransferase n=1 Tax=Erwinia citreus TaxID=558 RepID=UPI00289B6EF0|nr:GNAT family N-acetyltransferase [Erwinia sp.]
MDLSNRKLLPLESDHAYSLISQLRNTSKEKFIESVRIQTMNGYELVGAFGDEKMLGLMGFRPVHTLARVSHLHIDDLVVDEALRSSGIGKKLLDFATTESESRDMNFVFLDARQQAIPFYERNGFVAHTSPSMKKPLR